MKSDIIWRAGFEIEVVLGDLDDERFHYALQESMDIASPAYCQAVAKRLTAATGRRWTAPKTHPAKPGFYVVEEYDLDPLNWPFGRVAGVELLTPPLPLEQAEQVRCEIVAAIDEIDGRFNFRRSEETDNCAWHINIDAGEESLEPHKYILAVDELPLLRANNRLFSKYASPQRHAYGVALLRHLRADPQGSLLAGTGLTNLLLNNCGEGKRYACNFAKLERGYVELRHFSALTFFKGPPLAQTLYPITRAFESWAMEEEPMADALRRRTFALREWLDSFRSDLRWETGPMNIIATGHVFLDEEKIADLTWNGSFDIRLRGRKRYQYIAEMYDVGAMDICDAVGVLALDLAELINLGHGVRSSGSTKFQGLLKDLASRFQAPELQMPAPDGTRRNMIWSSDQSALNAT